MGFRRYDVLIITALLDELEAVLALGEGGKKGWTTEKDSDGFPFHSREIPREDGREPLRIAAASFDEMGGDVTAARATALIKFLDPACLAMCGICAGKKKDVFLGDVIVASRVYRYDSGKFVATPRDKDGHRVEEFFHDFKAFNLKDAWRVDAAYFAREKDWTAEWVRTRPLSLETQQQWFLRTLLEHEQLGADAPDRHPDRKKSCPAFTIVRDRLRKRDLLVNRPGALELTEEGKGHAVDLTHEEDPPRDPDFRIHVGPIATAEVVQKDPELFDRLEKIGRKTLGAEMESAAIGRVGEQLGRPTLIVKAVSDYGDEDKDDAFREFAAHASAQVLLRLLLRNQEPVSQDPEEDREPEPRAERLSSFLHMDSTRGDDLLSRVKRATDLRAQAAGEMATVIRRSARPPFGSYLRVTKGQGPFMSEFPIAAVEQVTAEVLDAFLEHIDARYRRLDPGVRSVLVYVGAPPSPEVGSKARARHVLLQGLSEYQGLIDFNGYLERQTRRLLVDPRYPPDLYVPQRLEFPVEGGNAEPTDALEALSRMLDSPLARFVLVLGDFGTGKTFLLHELARRLAEQRGPLIPVLIELRALEKARKLDTLIAQHLSDAGLERIDLPAFRYMLSEGRIVLLFDGFDELALRVSYERAIEHFATLSHAAQGEAKVIVTSRSQHFYSEKQVKLALAEQASSLKGYRLARIQPFTHEQIHHFLENRLKDLGKAARRLQLLDEVKDLMGLAHNPRMLGFISDIPEEKLLAAKARQDTITAAGLYEELLNQWLEFESGRVNQTGGPPGLTVAQRWKAVTDLAMRFWHRMERTLNILELPAELTAAVKELTEHNISSEEVQHQIGSGTLLVRDDGNNFSFIHQSVMEWIVAKAIAQDLRQGGPVAALEARELSSLMADFVWELAGREATEQWARRTLAAEGGSTIHRNAFLLLERLGLKTTGGLKLAGQNLSGKDFSGQDLKYSDLSGTNLTGAKLVGTDLTGALLTGASLQAADLSQAILAQADMRGADMSGARMMGVDATGAQFMRATLRRAKLVGARFDPGVIEGLDTRALFGAAVPGTAQPTPTVSSILPCYGVAISPDEGLIASSHGIEIRLWDLETGSMLCSLKGHQGLVMSVSFSPDGGTLATGSEDATVRLWDVATGSERHVLKGHAQRVMSMSFSPDGRTLATGSKDATVRLWDVATGSERRVLTGHAQGVMSVSFSPDGGMLTTGSEDATVRLWDVATGSERRVLKGHAQGVLSMSFSPDGRTLAMGSLDATVRLWDVATGSERHILTGHAQRVMSVSFSPNGRTLATGSWDATVRLWDVTTGSERRVLTGHTQGVMSVSFSPNGRTLVTGSWDATVRLWDIAMGSERHVLKGHAQRVWSVSFSPDGGILATGSEDATVRLWDVAKGSERRVLKGHTQRVLSMSFSPNGGMLATGSLDATVRLWDMATGSERHVLKGHTQRVWSAPFSPDGETLATGSEDATVRLWDVATGSERRVLKGHAQGVMSTSFSPDAGMLATGSWDATVRLWDVATGSERRVLKGHAQGVMSVSFSPDEGMLATGSLDATVRLWNVATGSERRVLKGHAQGIMSVSFSPDGRTLATGSLDATVRLWDVATGSERHILTGHAQGVMSMSFSPDGGMLATGSEDATVRLWDVASRRCLAVLVSLDEGWVAFTPEGNCHYLGNLGGAFWHVIGLCRFEPGELDPYLSLRVPEQEPLYRLPTASPAIQR